MTEPNPHGQSEVRSLKPGDCFDWADHPAWHGPGVVIECYEQRPSTPFSKSLWKLTFDAPVVNPPGLWYGDGETAVVVL